MNYKRFVVYAALSILTEINSNSCNNSLFTESGTILLAFGVTILINSSSVGTLWFVCSARALRHVKRT